MEIIGKSKTGILAKPFFNDELNSSYKLLQLCI